MGLPDKLKSRFARASDQLDDLERKMGKDDDASEGEEKGSGAREETDASADADGESRRDES